MNSEIIIAPVFFISLAYVIKVISDNRLRRHVVEKGLVNPDLIHLKLGVAKDPIVNVKWGLILVGIGLAALIGPYLPGDSDETIVALMFLFAGAGFLIYFAIARSHVQQEAGSGSLTDDPDRTD